jgi:hypothetical protein
VEESEPKPQTQPTVNAIAPQGSPGHENSESPRNPPVPTAANPAPEHKAETYQCRPDQTPIMKLVLEVLAVAVVGAYTVAAYQQLDVMRGQLGEIIKQYPELQKSATAAKSAADTADATLKSSEISSKQQIRAYITTSEVAIEARGFLDEQFRGFTQTIDINHPPNFTMRACWDVEFLNVGHTPTAGLSMNPKIAITETSPRKAIESLEGFPHTNEPAGYALGPAQRRRFTMCTHMIPARDAIELIAGQSAKHGQIYIYGIIGYWDIFREYHELGYCHRGVPYSTAFGSCEYGNWLDQRPKPKH